MPAALSYCLLWSWTALSLHHGFTSQKYSADMSRHSGWQVSSRQVRIQWG
jgi:hypothetical protein